MQKQAAQQAPAWFTVHWQLAGHTDLPRRTLATSDELVVTFMHRALEEASLLGMISAEEAFSSSRSENWRVCLLSQEHQAAQPLEPNATLPTPSQGTLKLEIQREEHPQALRAAPLRLSLAEITDPLPTTVSQTRTKGSSKLTWLLLLLIIALLGASTWLLLHPKKQPTSPAQTRRATTTKRANKTPAPTPPKRSANEPNAEEPTTPSDASSPEKRPQAQPRNDNSDDDDGTPRAQPPPPRRRKVRRKARRHQTRRRKARRHRKVRTPPASRL